MEAGGWMAHVCEGGQIVDLKLTRERHYKPVSVTHSLLATIILSPSAVARGQ